MEKHYEQKNALDFCLILSVKAELIYNWKKFNEF